jgi:hypothetical protein
LGATLSVHRRLQNGELKVIDFIEFAESWMLESKNTSKKNYKSAVNALKLYINREELNIRDITNKFLTGFMEFLDER